MESICPVYAPLPTTKNANCSQCDPQASPVPSGIVGTFEGADYYHCAAFRPEYDCRMRTLGVPFCRVCQDVILRKLTFYSPLNKRFAWKGVGNDQNIYFGWGGDSDQYRLSDRGTSTGPVLTNYFGTLMVWKGAFNDQQIWYSRQTHIDGVTWDTQHSVPGVGTSTGHRSQFSATSFTCPGKESLATRASTSPRSTAR